VLIFKSLASGSSGNAYLLRTDKVAILLEAGVRLPNLRRALLAEGLQPADLSAVLVSHEHRDHCLFARELAERYSTHVWANERVLRAAGLDGVERAVILPVGAPTLFGDVEVTAFPVAHDASCPVGFHIRTSTRTIVVATDLGEVSSDLGDAVSSSDLIVLEANHDTEMLHQGRYPYHLRKRVAGPTGHLSNMQAASLLARTVRRTDVDVWLAHLSKENNTPELAVRTVKKHFKAAGQVPPSIGVALRDRPSLRWTGTPRPRQLSMFGDLA
jgi:phosphoribosyl 1,2-cyclic phosphodiesterase